MAILPKVLYRLSAIPTKIPRIFCRNGKLDPQIIWNSKELWIAKTMWKQQQQQTNQQRCRTQTSSFKTCYKESYSDQNSTGLRIDIWTNGIELRIQKQTHVFIANRFSARMPKTFNGERSVSSTNNAGTRNIQRQKNKVGPLCFTIYKN